MPNSEQNPWKITNTSTAYDNAWITVKHNEVINPSGNNGIYGVVHFKNLAIGVLPLDEEDNTWLVGQFRFPNNCYSWEMPEGGGNIGTDPLASAKRELLEETGLTAQSWTRVLDIHMSNSVTDEVAIAYVARNLTMGEAEPEETEQLKLRKLPFSEVVEMVMRGEIFDSLTVATVLKVQLMKLRGEI
jgi:8-oxo-dGTP pyrophosphatase MutT (NUDIX family)